MILILLVGFSIDMVALVSMLVVKDVKYISANVDCYLINFLGVITIYCTFMFLKALVSVIYIYIYIYIRREAEWLFGKKAREKT